MFARDPATGQCVRSGKVVNERDVSDESWQSFGAKNIRASVEATVQPLTTTHHGHMPEIELTSPTAARGIWAMEDVIRYDRRRRSRPSSDTAIITRPMSASTGVGTSRR
jgi:hypothetical protein